MKALLILGGFILQVIALAALTAGQPTQASTTPTGCPYADQIPVNSVKCVPPPPDVYTPAPTPAPVADIMPEPMEGGK